MSLIQKEFNLMQTASLLQREPVSAHNFSMKLRVGICLAVVLESLILVGCVQPIQENSTKTPDVSYSSGVFGPGAPSWLTQADYDDYRDTVAENARKNGITDPTPALVRWIRPDEWAKTYGECFADVGMVVRGIDEVRNEIDASPPPGQEALSEYAWWYCFAKYPQMPDSEHGKFSERTMRIMYEWASKDLVTCLEEQGYRDVGDIPSYEYFKEYYSKDGMWHPYVSGDVFAFGREKGIDIEARCPQWPTDGRLDYQYHEEE